MSDNKTQSMLEEDLVAQEWNKYRRLALKATSGIQRRSYQSIADQIQHLLENYSEYGRALVWSTPSGALVAKEKLLESRKVVT